MRHLKFTPVASSTSCTHGPSGHAAKRTNTSTNRVAAWSLRGSRVSRDCRVLVVLVGVIIEVTPVVALVLELVLVQLVLELEGEVVVVVMVVAFEVVLLLERELVVVVALEVAVNELVLAVAV